MIKLVEGKFSGVMSYCDKHMKDKPFVFELRYVSMDSRFNELNRFVWESRHTERARFRNHYEGNVVINVTAWNEHGTNEYLEAFLYYLKDHEKQFRCCLFSEIGFSNRFLESFRGIFSEMSVVKAGEIRRRKEKAVIGFSPDTAVSFIGTAAKASDEI